MTFRRRSRSRSKENQSSRVFPNTLLLTLCSTLVLETAIAPSSFAAALADPEPAGTLLLPLTPKLDTESSGRSNSNSSSATNSGSASGNSVNSNSGSSSSASANGSSANGSSANSSSGNNSGGSATGNTANGSTSASSDDSNAQTADVSSDQAGDSDKKPISMKPIPSDISPEKGDVEEANVEDDTISESDKLLKGTVQIIADDTEYNEADNTFLGTGNAIAIIAGQNSKLEADMILYNQTDQTIDARGNVKINRDNQITTGSAFKFKVTSDEYLITKPHTLVQGSEIIARTAKGAKEGMAFKNGTISMPTPFSLMKNAYFGPQSYRDLLMEKKQHPEAYVPNKSSWHITAKKIIYERYKEEGNLTAFGAKIYFGKSPFGVPIGKFVATIGQNSKVMFPVTPLIGSNLQVGGTNLGPAYHYAMGDNGVMTWSPLLQLGGTTTTSTTSASGIGLGGQVSYTNTWLSGHLAYGSVSNLLVADLKARIRKNFKFQSGINRFMDDGMLGQTRARLRAELTDMHSVSKIPFISNLNFRTSAGWAQDNPQLLNLSPQYEKLFTGVNTTSTAVMKSAFRIQEQITASTQPLFTVGDQNWGVKGFIYGGAAMRAYSTGDKQIIGQVGPVIDAHLGRVRLQTGYTQSAVNGSTPFVFDEFIQGTRSTFLAGDVRINKYLTLGTSLGYNLVIKQFYGESFTAAIGPQDFKLLLMGDLVRGTTRLGFDVLYGQPVPYQKLVLKTGPDQGQLGGI